ELEPLRSVPPSIRARGRSGPLRPWGAAEVLPAVPVVDEPVADELSFVLPVVEVLPVALLSLPRGRELSLQATAPSRAAAEARVNNLRIITLSFLERRKRN